MFKLLISLLLATRVASFTAPRAARSHVSMSSDMVGSSAPLGFFDPLGFTKGADAKTLTKYRESELKHGRVAMLAVFGVLTAERFHPLYDGKLSSNPIQAFFEVPPLGFVQIMIVAGALEHALQTTAAANPDYKAGDYYGITNRIIDAKDPAWVGFQTRELNNGRLAMFAILGELVHAALTGKGPLEGLNVPGQPFSI